MQDTQGPIGTAYSVAESSSATLAMPAGTQPAEASSHRNLARQAHAHGSLRAAASAAQCNPMPPQQDGHGGTLQLGAAGHKQQPSQHIALANKQSKTGSSKQAAGATSPSNALAPLDPFLLPSGGQGLQEDVELALSMLLARVDASMPEGASDAERYKEALTMALADHRVNARAPVTDA